MVAQHSVRTGKVDFAGLGRMVLAYPELPADVLAGRPLQRKRICRTFSDCTTGPRNGLISGCYPLDDLYKRLPEAGQLEAIKAGMKVSAPTSTSARSKNADRFIELLSLSSSLPCHRACHGLGPIRGPPTGPPGSLSSCDSPPCAGARSTMPGIGPGGCHERRADACCDLEAETTLPADASRHPRASLPTRPHRPVAAEDVHDGAGTRFPGGCHLLRGGAGPPRPPRWAWNATSSTSRRWSSIWTNMWGSCFKRSAGARMSTV